MINQFVNEGCDLCKKHHSTTDNKASCNYLLFKRYFGNLFIYRKKYLAWIYGLIAATIVTISSLVGSVLYPLERNRHFAKILMFLMAVAIGTLIGTSTIHLIPHVKHIFLYCFLLDLFFISFISFKGFWYK